MTAQAMKARRGRSLFFIDIAVPRDVEPSVNDLDNVYLYDIDNLSKSSPKPCATRQSEAGRAESSGRSRGQQLRDAGPKRST